MFLQNKYSSVYNSIIDRSKSRNLSKTTYVERHHIIPKSLGGSNSKDNLVKLTAREHRLVHLLLPKMVSAEADIKKMWYAAWMILRVKNSNQNRNISKSKLYEIAKLNFIQTMSELHKGKRVSEETKRKMSESRRAYWAAKRDTDS